MRGKMLPELDVSSDQFVQEDRTGLALRNSKPVEPQGRGCIGVAQVRSNSSLATAPVLFYFRIFREFLIIR